MRNNRLTTNTTDPVTGSRSRPVEKMPNYDLIPFKNKDIDRLKPRELPEPKSEEQYKADYDAKREAIRLGKEKAKRDEPKMIPRPDPKQKLKSKIS